MRNSIISVLFSILLLFFSNLTYSQVPQKMGFQAIIRDATNTLVINQQVGIRISILQGSVTGTSVYTETHTSNTNINGLITIEIGTGNVLNGVFGSINWANGPYFIKTESDPTGGSNYSLTSTSQLLSVPYAFHANTADSVLKPFSNVRAVIKTIDETRTRDTIIKNDSELKFILKPNSSYVFEFNLYIKRQYRFPKNYDPFNYEENMFALLYKLNFDGDCSSIKSLICESNYNFTTVSFSTYDDSTGLVKPSENISAIYKGLLDVFSYYFIGPPFPTLVPSEFSVIKMQGAIEVGIKGGTFGVAWSNNKGFAFNDLITISKLSHATITQVK